MAPLPERLAAALADRYRLERELGQGGMATVYLAHDLKHDRQIAIKVLRPELAAVLGAERFVAEIKTTAALQHPHILPLFDSGTADGFLYYVMPYIEGETLRSRLDREKQLGIEEAVKIATSVADALDYAHRHGVIHRDIKPENILLHDGRPMVADFGIALAVSAAAGGRMTETGLSLGTPHYMSPEQATADRDITARSDVYSLASVLYEMLTGDPPHTGSSAQQIIMKVVTETPLPVTQMRKSVPPNVAMAVAKALEKLPADRFASAAEFATSLGNPSFAFGPTPNTGRRARPSAAVWLPWALFLIAAGVIAFERLRPKPPPPRPEVYRFNIMLPEDAAWVGDIFSIPALSPDGRLLVYNGRDSTGHRWLYLRAMDRLDPTRIPGSENGSNPFFSPDGRWVGFQQSTRIVKVPVTGGLPETVCEAGSLVNGNGTWLESNVIVFADGTGLRQCTMAGQVSSILASDSAESFNSSHGLPGDRGVLFSIQRGSNNRLAVLDLRAKSLKSLDIPGSDPRYVATGQLVYVSPDELVRAVQFDLAGLAPAGEPVIIDEGARVDLGRAVMALSRNGTIVTAGTAVKQALELVDRSGNAQRLSAQLGEFSAPRVSPDGRRIAVTVGSPEVSRSSRGANIWLLDRAQGTLSRLSFDSSVSRPAWSSDGRHVAYVRQIGARNDLRLVNADGSAPAESLLALSRLDLWEVTFTPDGQSMVVRTVGGPGRRDIWRVPLDSIRRPTPLLQSSADEVSPVVSPDSRWLAYVSNESGRAEVYVRSFPGMGARFTVSLDGGTEPMWSPRGGELFYRSGPMMLAAEVREGSTFEVLRRTALFSNGAYAVDLTHREYDVTPDGRHFVMVRNLGGASYLTVILHRFENLGSGSSRAAPAAPAP